MTPRMDRMDPSFELPNPLPFKFRPSDRKLYNCTRTDVEAWKAFQRLTRGRHAIDPSWLLLWLGTEADSGARLTLHKDERWEDKWNGLRGVSKSLNLLAKKMDRALAKSELGPAPLPAVGYDRWTEHYSESVIAHSTLANFPAMLRAFAKLTNHYCEMHRQYLQELLKCRQSDPSNQNQRTVALLCCIEKATGHLYFARVAALVNVGRRLRGLQKVSEHSLAKLWKRHPELRIPV